MTTQVDPGPNLLLNWQEQAYAPHWLRAGGGSLLVHVFLIGLLLFLLSLPVAPLRPETEIATDVRRVTPLYLPPSLLTQKEPSRGKPATEVSVENLVPRPATRETARTQPPQPRQFQPPRNTPPLTPAPPPKLNEPPAIQAQTNLPTQLPALAGPTDAPAPKIQPQETPKLAFQTPGQEGVGEIKGGSVGRIAPPKTNVDDVVRSVARGAGQGPLSVGDMDPPPSLPDSLREQPTQNAVKSKLDLLSDPQGADFKPYLIRVLAIVRRNWLAIIPESARLGRRGVVTLQFIADRDGQVPKLVIASPSGAEALDRAAVAGISASVPLPPLPSDFKGREVRLQLSFKYNVP